MTDEPPAASPPDGSGDSPVAPGSPVAPEPRPGTAAKTAPGSKADTAGAGPSWGAEVSAGEIASAFVGRSLGRFRIEGVLGHGGMGTVYRAFDPTLKRRVALKVPRFDPADDPDLQRRVLDEARAAAAVSHPHLVEVYETGTIGDPDGAGRRCYIASALCDGPDLAEWLERRTEPVPPALAAALLIPLAEAVRRCHLAGVVHRDLKPANVLLDRPDPLTPGRGAGALPFVPKVSDFGVARVLEESVSATRTSRPVGTPLYMAPEQAEQRTGEIGPATDVWALGAILYELLTGRPPFTGATSLLLLKQIVLDHPPTPRALRPGLPAGLDAICMKCLRKRPADRYADAGGLAEDLAAWREGRAVSARRFGWRDRFAAWSRRPERIRDAGVTALVWNGALAGASVLMALDGWLGRDLPLPEDPGFAREAVTVAAAHGVAAAAAWRLLCGSRPAYWFCFLVAAICWTLAVPFGSSDEVGFNVFQSLPAAKYLVFQVVAAAFTVQFALFCLSWRARPPG